MHRSLRPSSLFLLAVFAAGGVVAPSLHEARHAKERAREQAAHLAEGHHHHAAGDTHDAVLDAPCAESLVVDLQCVLCHGVSVAIPTAAAASFAPALRAPHGTAQPARPAAVAVGSLSIRGPPERVA